MSRSNIKHGDQNKDHSVRISVPNPGQKNHPIKCDLNDLPALERNDLRVLWLDIFGKAPPRSISKPLMRRILAFELQARQQGGLSPAIKRRLVALARSASSGGTGSTSVTCLPAGSRLVREWNSVTHIVEATDEGFLWQGRHYRSLRACQVLIESF